mmetsp:Transcript_119896/g.208163  ORF Transcript_119896/g.208163 Transcript_119896/m.208163 type:complete len:268 (-) Transcript_119896:959-1762(-)
MQPLSLLLLLLAPLFLLGLKLCLGILLFVFHLLNLGSEFSVPLLLFLLDVLLAHVIDEGLCVLLLTLEPALLFLVHARSFSGFAYKPLLVLDAQSLGCFEVADVITILQVLLLSQGLSLRNVAVALLLKLRLRAHPLCEVRGLSALAIFALFKRSVLPGSGLRLLLSLLLAQMLDVLEHELVAGVLLQQVGLRSLVLHSLPLLKLLILLFEPRSSLSSLLFEVLLFPLLFFLLVCSNLLDLLCSKFEVLKLRLLQPLIALLNHVVAL